MIKTILLQKLQSLSLIFRVFWQLVNFRITIFVTHKESEKSHLKRLFFSTVESDLFEVTEWREKARLELRPSLCTYFLFILISYKSATLYYRAQLFHFKIWINFLLLETYMNWIVLPQNLYVEALLSNVIVYGEGTFKEVIEVKWGHKICMLIQ